MEKCPLTLLRIEPSISACYPISVLAASFPKLKIIRLSKWYTGVQVFTKNTKLSWKFVCIWNSSEALNILQVCKKSKFQQLLWLATGEILCQKHSIHWRFWFWRCQSYFWYICSRQRNMPVIFQNSIMLLWVSTMCY